jgi:hypothetical protein
LTKVEAGSYRILKSLGIVLKEGATQTEALAAVQAVAAGQAEDYANTNSGKLLVSQVKVNEAMEHLGRVTMPLTISTMVAAADKVDNLSIALDVLDNGMAKTTEGQRAQALAAADLAGSFSFLVPGIGLLADATKRAAIAAEDIGIQSGKAQDDIVGMGRAADDIVPSLAKVGDAEDDVGGASRKMAAAVAQASSKAIEATAKMRDQTISDARRLIDGAYDPEITRLRLVGTMADAAALKVIVSSGKATAAQKADLLSLRKEQADALLSLATSGNSYSATFKAAFADLKSQASSASGDVKLYLTQVIAKIDEVAKHPVKIHAKFDFSANAPALLNFLNTVWAPPRASGGPVQAGQAYTVGERGPETLVMGNGGGTIIPNGRGGSAGPTTVQLVLDGSVIAEVVSREMAWSQRLAGTGTGPR